MNWKTILGTIFGIITLLVVGWKIFLALFVFIFLISLSYRSLVYVILLFQLDDEERTWESRGHAGGSGMVLRPDGRGVMNATSAEECFQKAQEISEITDTRIWVGVFYELFKRSILVATCVSWVVFGFLKMAGV